MVGGHFTGLLTAVDTVIIQKRFRRLSNEILSKHC